MMKIKITLGFIISIVCLANGQKFPFDPNLKPFYHGVASGDPLEDRVIIWTRVTPEKDTTIEGTYIVATDTALKNIVKTGVFTTNVDKDYTVKVDVTGLQSSSTYYYTFTALGKRSAIGRTKTTPSVGSDNLSTVLKFAVVTCANYEGGYFNAYNSIASRNDLDAVIHLGDYFYEYGTDEYRNIDLKDSTRVHIPATELLTKADYRARYALYHLDKDLQRAHQQHPFIAVWDDHETANDAYDTGAENHQPNEGDWNTRKKIAKEAYFEWIPIRGTAESSVLYRSISYGKLMDLFILDTRMDGRQKQPESITTPDDSLNPRRIMSKTQFDWLINNLKNAQGRWKVIGNQVILSDINVGFAANNPTSLAEISFYEDQFLDSWEGYLLQRNALVDSIQKNNMKNVVFASGDSHASWAFDVTKQPVMYPVAQFSYIPQPNLYNPNTKTGYTPTTGEGSVAVEFCTPSISAENFDEILTVEISNLFEAIINNPIPQIPGSPNYNPHLKYVDFDRHGYLILDVRADSVQSDFFYTPSVVTVSTVDNWGGGVSSTYNSNHITTASTANRAAAKAVQDFPAPTARVVTALTENVAPVVFSLYPNPASSTVNVQYGLVRDADVDLMLVSIEGRIVKNIAQFKNQAAGVYSISNIDVSGLARGMYLLQIKTGNGITYRKFVIN